MKTKHILTALALPVMFAACTADDIEGLNNGLQQDARAKLSKNFVLNATGEAESRYAVEGTGELTMSWEEGDMIGANLVDQYSPSYKDDPTQWPIQYYVAPALPFKNVGKDLWKSDSELGVGNYLFTYPFNSKDNNRAAAIYELPVVQDLTSGDLNAAIKAGDKSVGAAVLLEGEMSKDIAMKHIFTYPKFVVNFDNGEKVSKVNQIVLKSTAGFIVKSGYNHIAISALFADNKTKFEAAAQSMIDKQNWDAKTEKVIWDGIQTYDFIINTGDKDYLTAKNYIAETQLETTSNYLIAKLDKAVSVDATTNNKYVEVRFMMPSYYTFSDAAGLELYAYTDNGIYKTTLKQTNFNFKSTTSQAAIDAALRRGRTNTLNLKPLSEKVVDVDNIVTSLEDWNALVNAQGATTIATALKVGIVGEEFTLNENAKMPSKRVFEINTNVNIEGDVTLKNITATKTIIVSEGATLTTDPTLTAAKINNKGNLVFAQELDEDEEVVVAYDGVTEVVNEGTVTVPANVIASFKLTNEQTGVFETTAAASRTTSVATALIYGTNKGIINNNGAIYVESGNTLSNKNPNTVTGNKKDKEGVWNWIPTINNKGEFIVEGTAENEADALFVNNGALAADLTGSAMNNAGLLQAKKGSFTSVSSNTGKVVVYEAAPADFDVTGGTIEYTATKATEDLSKSPVTHLIATQDLTVSNTYTKDNKVSALANLTVKGDAKIAFTADKAKLTNLFIESGKTTINCAKLSVVKLVVEEGAKLSIPAEKELEVTGANDYTEGEEVLNFENEGSIYVSGTLTAKTAEKDEMGSIVTSKGSKVYTKENADTDEENADSDALKAAKVTALQPLIDAYIANTSDIKAVTGVDSWAELNLTNIKGSYSKTYYDANAWVKTPMDDFVEAWNAIDEDDETDDITYEEVAETLDACKDLIGAYNATYKLADGTTTAASVLKNSYTKAVAGLATSISEVLGENQWIDYAYVKTSASQATKKITTADEAHNLLADFGTELVGLTKTQFGKDVAAWLTIQDLIAAVNDDDESLYPGNVSTYIPATSVIPVYAESDEYIAVKLWKDLTDKFGKNEGDLLFPDDNDENTVTKPLYLFDSTTPANNGIGDLKAFFLKIYQLTQDNEVKKNNPVFIEAAKTVTSAYVVKLDGWKYLDIQINAVAAEVAKAK